MGNCCGKQESGNFGGEGRTLGSTPANAPPQANKASVPAPKIPGQKLGGPSSNDSDARAAAARAAEERYQASSAPGGKLQNQLNKDKTKTQQQHLTQAANESLAHRQIDASVEAQRND